MNNEISRFSIVRNPQPIASEKILSSVIELIDTEDKTDDGTPDRLKHPYYATLLAMKQDNASRESIIEEARNMDLLMINQLNYPFGEFEEKIFRNNKLKLGDIELLIRERFKSTIEKVVKGPTFKNDKYKISDSLIVASIIRPKIDGFQGKLLRMRQSIFLLEFIAKNKKSGIDEKTIRDLKQATILLPYDLFPIPDGSEKIAEENKKAFEERSKVIKKQKDKITRIKNRLKKNKETIEELSSAYNKHLFDFQKPVINVGAIENTNVRAISNSRTSLFILPKEKFQTLNRVTIDTILREVGVTNDNVDILYVTRNLEGKNRKLIKELEVERGGLKEFLEKDKLSGLFDIKYGECAAPPQNFDNNNNNQSILGNRGQVNFAGIQDLLIVRQELLKYEPGEIAHIENVLQGELKSKKHRKLHRVEESVFEETEREETVEEELQTSNRFELQKESSRTISEDSSLESGLTVTVEYGKVNIEAHGNYAYNRASEESQKAASTYAKEILSRSVKKIQERVLNRRTRTEISEVEIINEHSIDNSKNPTGNIAGIYRWVNKLYKAQIVNYGKRVMLEFMIPEPAAFYRFAKTARPNNTITVEKPEVPGRCVNGIFHKLKPSDIGNDYMIWIAKYGAAEVNPPPAKYINIDSVLAHKVEDSSERTTPFALTNKDFNITSGYIPIVVKYRITGGNAHSISSLGTTHDDNMLVQITINKTRVFKLYKNEIGKTDSGPIDERDLWDNFDQLIYWDESLSEIEKKMGSVKEGNVHGQLTIDNLNSDLTDNPNQLFVSITGHSTLPLSVAVHYSVLCERSPTKHQQWQIETYSAIMDAYNAMRLDYEEASQQAEFETEINIQGQNPLINREIEKTELKKHTLSILTGQHFDNFNSMGFDSQLAYPQVNNFEKAASEGEFVRFFEQALEWRHLTYLFYDYFWAKKKHWIDILNVKDTDPLFEKFLKAGFSRVWIPIRPGFESTVLNYICSSGEPWSEKTAPLCSEFPSNQNGIVSPELSIIEEIKEQLHNDFENRLGSIEVIKDSKLVRGIDTDFRDDDIDREILINLKPYRITKVNSSTEIELKEAYEGETDSFGVAIGVKHVGEPWVVEVPTSLVWLQQGNNL